MNTITFKYIYEMISSELNPRDSGRTTNDGSPYVGPTQQFVRRRRLRSLSVV